MSSKQSVNQLPVRLVSSVSRLSSCSTVNILEYLKGVVWLICDCRRGARDCIHELYKSPLRVRLSKEVMEMLLKDSCESAFLLNLR